MQYTSYTQNNQGKKNINNKKKVQKGTYIAKNVVLFLILPFVSIHIEIFCDFVVVAVEILSPN